MKKTLNNIKKSVQLGLRVDKSYKKLRAHLDKQPVGFPSTFTGVEMRLLQEHFTPDEAEAALDLTWRLETFDVIAARARARGNVNGELPSLLKSMEDKGCIFVKRDGDGWLYSLHPFVVGMFEMQLNRLSPGLFMDTGKYIMQNFATEYLTTEVPQMRVIPVNKSVDSRQKISTYDEIRAIVESAPGQISISDCICKKGHDLLSDPCKKTDRREVCMGLRDFADTWIRHGWGREITKEEALEILDQNEQDGLMLVSATMQEPEFICSCCGCCCGVMEMLRVMPRVADFTASNFQAQAEPGLCTGCEVCLERCQIDAVDYDHKAKHIKQIDTRRCIGCGLCVPTCPEGAIQLFAKPVQFVPPKDHEALYETIMEHKPGRLRKAVKLTKAILGRKV